MMLRRISVILLLLLPIAGCTQPPVRDELTLDFSGEDDSVTVTAETIFELEPKTREARTRIDDARAAALAGTDAWSARFARFNPEVERTMQQRRHGELERVSRSVVIGADELQQVFSDSSITVRFSRSAATCELLMFPGGSTRASREQQRRFDEELNAWSGEVAHYYNAIHHLYAYMNANPERARYMFAALLDEKGVDGADPVVFDEEQALVDAVSDAMEQVAQRLDDEEGRAATFAEETDMIFNPFPARITVRVPGHVSSNKGFTDQLTIEPIDLLGSVAKLEGRWISPDPLAALLREETPTAEQLAREPRSADAVVNASEIAAALRAELTRPTTYSLHWRC
jgi:hypothetical protein